MKDMKKWKVTLPVVLALTATMGGYIAFGAGDSTDPLISKSYLDNILVPNILSQIDTKIDQKLATIDVGSSNNNNSNSNFGNPTVSNANVYVSVQVSAGQIILGDEGAQFILRSGSATSVCPGANGLVDTTSGTDVGEGAAIQPNHVYITPRDDGRGFHMYTDGYLMIKGNYSIH